MTIMREQRWRRLFLKAQRLRGGVSLGVGVDWGSRLIKTVVLQKNHHGIAVRDFSIQSSAGENPGHASYSDVEIVQRIQKNMFFPNNNAIGSVLSGPSVFIKTITFPVMTEEDLRNHLALELDRYIALDPQEVFWDIYHRKPFTGSKTEQQEHFLVVAKKECVERQVEAFSRCGATVRFVDVDAFALVNLVTHHLGQEGSWLLVHMGPTGMVMVVIVQGEPAFIRKVSYEAAWYGDLLDQILVSQTSREPKNPLGVSEALLLEQFIQETREQIRETLESFSDSSTMVTNKGILLSGGYAVVPEIAETLADGLGMAVQLLNPFESITVPQAIQEDHVFQRTAPLMSIAVGVALRGAQTDD